MGRSYVSVATVLLLTVLLVPYVSANHSSVDITRVRKYGPQVNNLVQVTTYGNIGLMWEELIAGTLDFGDEPIGRAELDEFSTWPTSDVDADGQPDCLDTATGQRTDSRYRPGTDPLQAAICLESSNEFGMRVLDINNVDPLGSNVHFRRAIAHLSDMSSFITNICQGLCTDLQGMPIPNPAMADWRNPSAAAAFPKYDPTAAWAELETGGITDVDGDHILEMDLNGDGIVASEEEPVIEHYSRLDINKAGYGKALRDKYAFDNPSGDPNNIRALFGAGFKYNYQEVTFNKVFADIFDPNCANKKHTLYQGSWAMGISPALLYFLYVEDLWLYGRFNYNCVRIPELFHVLEELAFAPDGPTALAAALRVQDIFAKDVPVVPLWSNILEIPYRAIWKDVVAAKGGMSLASDGGGANTDFNLLTAGMPGAVRPWVFRWNAFSPPNSLNVVYGSDDWAGLILGRVYDSLVVINPHKPTILGNEGLMPWLIKDWTTGTYSGAAPNGARCPVASCDVIMFNLDSKHPILFHDGTQMTADDIAFSIEYSRDSIPYGGWQGQRVFDVIDTLVPNAYEVRIYFDSRSFFHLINSAINIYPKNLWCPTWPNMADPSCTPFASPPPIFETAPAIPDQGAVTGQIGTGPFKLVNWDPAAGIVLLERFDGYFKSSAVYDSFHASGNVNGLSPDMIAHLQSVHGYPVPAYSILTDNSNKIDVLDLVSIGGNFGKTGVQAPKADLNEDNLVNILDLVRVGGNMFKDWDHGDWTTFPAPAGHPITYP